MTDKPTPEQIQRACDRANVGGTNWRSADYGLIGYTAFTALADTIAELDAMEDKADAANVRANNMRAERDKAEADLREIDRIASVYPALPVCFEIAAIAAPYRVETDPLVSQFPALLNLLRYHETGGHEGDGTDGAVEAARSELLQLAKRGIEV